MDPEQTFLRVHARLSGVLARLLTPRFRAGLECACLFNALLLLALLVVMHVNFVAQPGCAEHFSNKEMVGAQLVQIKITGSWNRITEEALGRGTWKHDTARQQYTSDGHSGEEFDTEEGYQVPDMGGEGWNILAAKFWLNLPGTNARQNKPVRSPQGQQILREEFTTTGETGLENGFKSGRQSGLKEDGFGRDVSSRTMAGPGRGPLGTALLHYFTRWSSYGTSCFKRAEQGIRSFWQVWRITGWEPFTTTPKGDRRTVAWNKLDAVLVDLPENGSRIYDPTYLYSIEKGYLMMSESAKLRHDVKTINISISAQHSCFGNRWQQLLIDNFVGYDTILMNSLLSACGRGYLYNFQTKELYNLNYLQDFGDVPIGIDDYIVFKCGVLITSLFVFFTTTMSVSFTLRETQARMLKFTVQLQHHARHRLPTYRLIFIHVVESLVFVPIMIGILFFLFEFFDDQLLAFMVLTLVWLCELFTMISVRTPLLMKFFPRFFFLYFMVFHIYFFSYTYGFSYLAFSATAAFMQHLVLYFWNRFEIPALQNFLHRRVILQQQGVHITSSSTILTSTVQVSQGNPVTTSSQNIRGVAAGLNTLRAGGVPDNQTGTGAPAHVPSGSRGPSTPPDSGGGGGPNDPNSTSRRYTNITSEVGYVPPGMSSSWMNNPIHSSDSNMWRRRLELDRLQRVRAREDLFREHGMESRFGVQAPGEAHTARPPLMHSPPFTSYGSVLPWIPGGSSSLFLPVFHELGDARRPEPRNNDDGAGNVDATTNASNSTVAVAAESGASQTTDDRLRHRRESGSSTGEAGQTH